MFFVIVLVCVAGGKYRFSAFEMVGRWHVASNGAGLHKMCRPGRSGQRTCADKDVLVASGSGACGGGGHRA